MSKRISPGTSCTVGGRPGVVQNGVGSGDYIVRMGDGRRVVVDGRQIDVPKTEEELRTDVQEENIVDGEEVQEEESTDE